MLPEAKDGPGFLEKHASRVAIARRVGVELGAPPLRVGSRESRMLRAPVPETAVDEDRQLGAREGDVDAASRTTGHGVLNPVSMPRRMKCSTYAKFGLSVSTSLP